MLLQMEYLIIFTFNPILTKCFFRLKELEHIRKKNYEFIQNILKDNVFYKKMYKMEKDENY